jgi:5-methylcytosine-specific restriction protein A
MPKKLTFLKPRVPVLSSSITGGPKQLATYGQGRGGRPWRRKREQILLRDQYLCQCEQCGGKRLLADEIDHIVPLSQGGTDDLSNLRAINKDCHKAKTAREASGSSGVAAGADGRRTPGGGFKSLGPDRRTPAAQPRVGFFPARNFGQKPNF